MSIVDNLLDFFVFKRLFIVSLIFLLAGFVPGIAFGNAVDTANSVDAWQQRLDDALIASYDSDDEPVDRSLLTPPGDTNAALQAAGFVAPTLPATAADVPLYIGILRARTQQAMVMAMAKAVQSGDVPLAQAWRAEIDLPRGVSASEGALILANLPTGESQRHDAARSLVRESITWHTARVRQLLADATLAVSHADAPMPGRLREQLGEAIALAQLPPALSELAGVDTSAALNPATSDAAMHGLIGLPWADIAGPLSQLKRDVESHLPSLLSDKEKQRQEKLLLKLVTVIPAEYRAGVRDGQISVPLEYREAVSFSAQAREFADQLTPLWLSHDHDGTLTKAVENLEQALNDADQAIAKKSDIDLLNKYLQQAASVLTGPLGISNTRGGSTSDIVDSVMLDTRARLGESLAAANSGKWSEAESLRLEAYTTYDPDLEARLMPRDPQLATDIEHLLLDGLDQPGVKSLLDRRVNGPELEAAYSRVNVGLQRAAALLKSGADPLAAGINAGSIVLREGLEGLLVIVAILAGLRGDENARRRKMIWLGVALSMVATIATVVLSQTVITRLHYYGEIIEAVASILAIGVLLLITNWLFQQVYWRQWVCTLKGQAEAENAWQLVMVGFLIGYREGFETVLFVQSLVMDVGGGPVMAGVAVGLVLLIVIGVLALVAGWRLPYFKLLLGTAVLIGVVLVTFVGSGVRSLQTVGWLPVHKLMQGSWPAWLGSWFGAYNTWETIGGQLLACVIVLGTWRISRWNAKRNAAKRQAARVVKQTQSVVQTTVVVRSLPVITDEHCEPADCHLDFNDPQRPCSAEHHAEVHGEQVVVVEEREVTVVG